MEDLNNQLAELADKILMQNAKLNEKVREKEALKHKEIIDKALPLLKTWEAIYLRMYNNFKSIYDTPTFTITVDETWRENNFNLSALQFHVDDDSKMRLKTITFNGTIWSINAIENNFKVDNSKEYNFYQTLTDVINNADKIEKALQTDAIKRLTEVAKKNEELKKSL